MVLNLAPAPFEMSGFDHGATNAREEALLNAQKKQEEQTELNRMHAGGSRVEVPQISTGAGSDDQLNKHIAAANKTLMHQQAAAEFDKLALTNSVKKGGRKQKSKKSMRKSKRKSTKKAKKTARKTRRNKRKN